MLYIAYGSNMNIDQMSFRCPHARLIGTGHISRARLEFRIHATVERTRSKIDRVPVAVWEVTPSDVYRLDRYEGFPTYYTKTVWPVEMDDGSQIEGMIYIMRLRNDAPPSVTYYEGIRQAYIDLGLSSEIHTVLEPALIRSRRRAAG